MSGFEWLVREHAGETAMATGSRFVVDDERWSGSVERVVVSPSLHVVLNDLQPRRDFGVEPVDEHFDDHVVGQVTLDGRVSLSFRDGEEIVAAGSHALLYRSPGELPTYKLSATVPFRSLAYQIDLERIGRLFGADMPAALAPLLESRLVRSRHVATRADRHMSAIAASLFDSDLNGPLRRLLMEGGALQLLALQAAAASRQALPPSGLALSARERDAVHEAQRLLLADMRNPPTLGELAQAVGLAERRLSGAFRLEFGVGPFEMLRDHRLEHARQVLEQGVVTLKEVSFRVGYNHVSNFVHAFRARYGASPRQFIESEP
ncbi:MAG: helix-turn-helix transcriptional regulator [Rhodospirillales bacterium]|nr:helix-turn-helix transcriptional regulator [Rhodospirillales bacterium]